MKTNTQLATPTTLIERAIEKGLDVDKMTQLFDLQERWEKKEAKKVYDLAMNKLQAELPIIEKKMEGGKTATGKVAYYYAPLEYIVDKVRAVISQNGFSYRFKVENEPDKVRVMCIVNHEGGHTETSTMETGLSARTGVMSVPQQIASTVTFNKRYAFMNAFGITVGGEDDDAQDIATTENAVEEAKGQLQNAKTVKELDGIFGKLPKEVRADKGLLTVAVKLKKEMLKKELDEKAKNE